MQSMDSVCLRSAGGDHTFPLPPAQDAASPPSHLAFSMLESRIPSAAPQIWMRSLRESFSRSAPEERDRQAGLVGTIVPVQSSSRPAAGPAMLQSPCLGKESVPWGGTEPHGALVRFKPSPDSPQRLKRAVSCQTNKFNSRDLLRTVCSSTPYIGWVLQSWGAERALVPGTWTVSLCKWRLMFCVDSSKTLTRRSPVPLPECLPLPVGALSIVQAPWILSTWLSTFPEHRGVFVL